MKICLEKAQENGPAGRKKGKTERVTGLGRKTKVESNDNTEIPDGVGGGEGDIRHSRSPFGGSKRKMLVDV